MERADIKRILKEMGVAEALTEMPAVIEPIYKELMEKPESYLRRQGKVNVDEQGNFSFGNRRIKLKEDSCAEITFNDAKVTTNPVGIEISYEDGDFIGLFSSCSRGNGIITYHSGNNGNCSWSEREQLDNGSWSILSARGIKVGEDVSPYNKNGEYTPFEGTVEGILSEFDSNSKTIIENYPQTEEWYKEKREEVKAVVERETDPEEQNKRRIEYLEKRVSALEKNKNELLSKLSKSTEMLEKALRFIGKVKSSPVGKVFFARGIKKYEEDTKKLTEGREYED